MTWRQLIAGQPYGFYWARLADGCWYDAIATENDQQVCVGDVGIG